MLLTYSYNGDSFLSVLMHIDCLHFIAISVSSFACYFEVYENLFFS
jgi:hypothetical protein